MVALFTLIVVPTSGKLKVRSIKTNILIKTAQLAKLAQLDIAQKEIHLKLHFELSFESDQWFRAWEKKVDEKVFCNQQKTRFKLVPDRTNTLHWRSSNPELIGLEAPLSRTGDVVSAVQLLTTELSSNPDQVL